MKAALDVSQVPELFVLLHSSELPLQRTQQRTFLLQLLRDGLRNRLDYLVCARRRVFRLLLSIQPSELLADSATKVILKKNYFLLILNFFSSFLFSDCTLSVDL